jgi:peptidyl-prolyl cis-trans isomerase C
LTILRAARSLAVIVVLGSAAACQKAPASGTAAPASGATPSTAPPSGSSPSAAPAAAPVPPPAPLPPMPVPATIPPVVALVNDEDIKKADFDMLVRNVEVTNSAPIPANRRDEILRRVLDDLVTYTLLKQEAKARGVAVTDAEVEERVAAMRKSAPNEDIFTKALAQRKMTLARLRADTRVELAIGKLMSAQVAGTPATTDAEAKEFYEKNPDRFKQPEMMRASHIMIRFDPAAGEAGKAAARARADALLKRAKAGEDFAALAREGSEHVSAAHGGDVNFFPRQDPRSPLPKEFTDAAFGLKANEISGLVETQNGFHIIKATDRKAAGTLPLAEVNDRLKQGMSEQKKQQQAQAFIAQLRQKAKIEVLI